MTSTTLTANRLIVSATLTGLGGRGAHCYGYAGWFSTGVPVAVS